MTAHRAPPRGLRAQHAAAVLLCCCAAATGAAAAAGGPPPGFLNGVNQAWVDYGNDFGNGQGARVLPQYEATLDGVKAAGGNSIRVWIHCTGDNTPVWAADGSVAAADKAGSFVGDVGALADAAEARGIKVFFSLWNGALMHDEEKGLILDAAPGASGAKVASYVDKVLTPLVQSLAGHAGVGGWEIMNEPEGSVAAGVPDSNPCYDTSALKGTGAGWSGAQLPMAALMGFIGRLADAVHSADASATVTVGSWSEHALLPRPLWSDACLKPFGGQAHLDLYEVHSYAQGGAYGSTAPFNVNASFYKLDKPLVVGEFSQVSGAGMTSAQQYVYALRHGFAGAWGWQANGSGQGSDSFSVLKTGMAAASGVSPPPPPSCSDTPPPPATYSCSQQKGWGKCSASWMNGYCCKTCFDCNNCH